MFKVDLHTHSQKSPDGGLTVADYKRAIDQGLLDTIAVTDHNSISFAQELQRQFGEKIIIGEEITALEGELIGLYLKEVIPAGLSAAETVADIRKQGGLVYVPHPFESVRKGLPLAVLDSIANEVDIVEVHNGRAVFQNKSEQALVWAAAHHKAAAASSDAHGRRGWGKTYSEIATLPKRDDLVPQLMVATYQKGFVGARGILYPKLNRLRKKVKRG
jgi:predicted metal-dependent phosphoesterase TrpH